MGMDLISYSGAKFICSVEYYWRVLELAEINGWEPEGTTLPKWLLEEYGWQDWDGDYYGNDYQVVNGEDAANLAQAVERGLDDIPDEAVCTLPELKCVQLVVPNGIVMHGATPGAYDDRDIISFLAGDKQRLREFIDFCKAGAYETG